MRKFLSLLLGSLLLFCACHKEKGNEECTWTLETTAMTAGYCKMDAVGAYDQCNALQPGDSLSYDLLQMVVHFDTRYLPYTVCSTPHDSLVGKVAAFWVIALNDYNANYQSGDTLNDMISLRAMNNTGTCSDLIALNSWPSSNPNCTSGLRLFLTQVPSQAGLQSFRLIYYEADGTTFSLETEPIIIKP